MKKLITISPYPDVEKEDVWSALRARVQVLLELSPYQGAHNKVSFMINKTQAKYLIHALQRALDKDSDYCMPVLRIRSVTVRNPWNAAAMRSHLGEGLPQIMENVEGEIILDNY